MAITPNPSCATCSARLAPEKWAAAIVAAEESEIALYERNRDFVGYGYYVAKLAAPQHLDG